MAASSDWKENAMVARHMQHPVLSTLRARHCIRAFTDEPVPRHVLVAALAAAQAAPSNANTQPWQVEVVEGATRERLSAALVPMFQLDPTEASKKPDYLNRNKQAADPLHTKRYEQRYKMYYDAVALEGATSDKRIFQRERQKNFTFFGAQTALIIHMPTGSERGSFLDCGLFIQSLLLALKALGVDSCPQYSVCFYPDVVREVLGLQANRMIVLGISVGFAQPLHIAPINSFSPPRATLADVARWHTPNTMVKALDNAAQACTPSVKSAL
eukprot:gb/GEZN01011333.1/.p1 GENE.gb/GEZN01011333.1/~~gb/GEZN01011333.1/.p1  ORF type:complete len:271 (-),score=42.41 gb/GEZN01011333.1/:319-1131(-)